MGHWSDIKNDEWHWPNFTPKEIACRGTGELVVVSDAMDRLQTLRGYIMLALVVCLFLGIVVWGVS